MQRIGKKEGRLWLECSRRRNTRPSAAFRAMSFSFRTDPCNGPSLSLSLSVRIPWAISKTLLSFRTRCSRRHGWRGKGSSSIIAEQDPPRHDTGIRMRPLFMARKLCPWAVHSFRCVHAALFRLLISPTKSATGPPENICNLNCAGGALVWSSGEPPMGTKSWTQSSVVNSKERQFVHASG